MKKLLVVGLVLVAGCNQRDYNKSFSLLPDVFTPSRQGAGFSPYTLAEWRARAARGEPGLSVGNEYDDLERTAPDLSEGARIDRSGYVTPEQARERATSTPTTYRLSETQTYTVVRLPNGQVSAQFGYDS